MVKIYLCGWLSKIVTIILSVVNAKQLISLVGVDAYAGQSIIMSISAWIAVCNFGVPSTIQNMIGQKRATNQRYEELATSAFYYSLIIVMALVPAVLVLGYVLKKTALQNYNQVNIHAIFIYLMAFLINNIILFFSSMRYAEHDDLFPSIIPALISLGYFFGLFMLSELNERGLEYAAMAYAFPVAILALYCTTKYKYKSINKIRKAEFREVFRSQLGMFIFSLLGTAAINVDYFVLARILESNEISYYNILQKIFLTLLAVYGIVLNSNWSKMSEAIHSVKGRIKLLEIINKNLLTSSILLLPSLIIILCMDRVVDFISSGSIQRSDSALEILMLVYLYCRIFSDTFATAHLSISNTKILNALIPIQCVLSIVFQMYFGKKYGAEGVVSGLILSYIVTSLWYLPWKLYIIKNN